MFEVLKLFINNRFSLNFNTIPASRHLWNIRHVQPSLYHFDIAPATLPWTIVWLLQLKDAFCYTAGGVTKSHTGDTCRNPYKRIECPPPPQFSDIRAPPHSCHGGRMVVGMKLPYPLNIKHSDKHSDNATGLKVQYVRLLVIATTRITG